MTNYKQKFALNFWQLNLKYALLIQSAHCSLLIAGVYRPPSSTCDVDASITKNIEKAYLLNKEMVLLGDFNVDLLNANQSSKHKLIAPN